MKKDDLKNINLEVADFDLINEALEKLPTSEFASGLAASLFTDIMTRDLPPNERREIEAKLQKMKNEEKTEKALLKENIRLLQGKLIQLKRSLIENNLMN